MSELVIVKHDQPVTTSLAIAACTENEHGSVLLLVRKYINELEQFGEVNFQTAKPGNSRFEIANSVFEIENCRSEKGRQTEFAFLNEQQATLLVTFMRNTDVVRRFKVALVKAFYAMRDELLSGSSVQFVTGNPSHGADLAVSADRTFRSYLRAARSVGMALPQALRIANKRTVERTGTDMLAELCIDPDEAALKAEGSAREADEDSTLFVAVRDWLESADAGPGPWKMAEILRAVLGMTKGHADYDRNTVLVAAILRRMGCTNRSRRLNRGQPYRYWSRPSA